MQVAFRYVLGLDLGTSSVGSALIKLPEDESDAEIIHLGVRKFQDVYKEGDSPDKNNTTTNAERRRARLTRRQLARKRGRRSRTMALLVESGLAVNGPEPFPGLPRSRFSPYDIWARAYDDELSPSEFGRLLYMLAHRRGFKSNLGAGLGALKERLTIAQYVRRQEDLDEQRAANSDKLRRVKAASRGKDAAAPAADDDGKTLVQVGRWNSVFRDVPLGKYFFALVKGDGGASLAELAEGDTAVLGELSGNFLRQQVRNKASNPLWARPDRAAYEAEFELLWACQAKHLGLSDELKGKLYSALFFQNPLAFPQDNRAFCPYGRKLNGETGELRPAHRSPKCNLLFQEYRIWKLLADMKVKETPKSEYRHLEAPEKITLFKLLNGKKEVTWKEMKSELGKGSLVFEPSERKSGGRDYDEKRMVGNPIAGWFGNLKPEDAGDELIRLWNTPERFLRPDLRVLWKGTDHGRREAVRHHLIRLVGEAPFRQTDRKGEPLPKASAERVVVLLQGDFDLSDLAAFRLATASFPDGFGRLSYDAMSRLIPHLRNGKMEWEAIRDEFDQGTIEENRSPVRRLAAAPDSTDILSPRVRKALNQARHVVEAILAEHPEIELDEIRIEMARRMQLGDDAYRDLLIYQSYNQKMADQAREFWLARRPDTKMPGGFVEKYKLWIEAGMECPYSEGPNRRISQADLLNGSRIEVDHIWPRDLGGDSYGNKVLVCREANQRKGSKPPWQMPAEWRETVAQNIAGWPIFSTKTDDNISKQEAGPDRIKPSSKAVDIARGKINRVKASKPPADKEGEFADRQAVETGYIAKEAVTYLRPLARRVTAVKSSFSTSLAKNWGFYKRLSDLHEEERAKIPRGKKDRVLHRHHAVDALAVAFCSPKIIHRIVGLEKELANIRDARKALTAAFPDSFVPADDAEVKAKWLRKQVAKLQPRAVANGLSGELAKVIVSYEERHRARGKFFNEKPLGIGKKLVSAGQFPPYLNKRVPISALCAVQVFPELVKKKAKAKDGEDEEGGRKPPIKSRLARKRIVAFLQSKGIDALTKIEDIDKELSQRVDGIPYDAKGGQRWMRRVLVQAPADIPENYFARFDAGGGATLYPKIERHCAVIVANGKKSTMDVVPLVDAVVAMEQSEEGYRSSMINLAARRGKRDFASMRGAEVFHKGDLVRVRKHGSIEWEPELYKVEVLDGGGGRLWLRAHWSGDRSTKKGTAVGSLIASASVYEFRPVSVSAGGSLSGAS